ncbi:MAG: type 4a pilus biogenesis protein PilO [Ectobacillus sp.]
MNIRLSKKQLFLSFLAFVLMIFVFVYIYFAVVQPLHLEKEQLQQELAMQRVAVAGAKERPKSSEAGTQADYMLQKKLPVKPLVEQYMLDLEKAEGLSGVVILNVALQEEDATTKTDKQTEAAVPLTFKLVVKYTVYEQLQAFLKAVEEMPRITYVQGIQFKGREEIVSANARQEPYEGTLTVTTYYMPALEELEEGAPKLELPPLCKDRTNPIEPQPCR